jgi:5-(carboxyamino)imidazole ribonucleotide mutase
MKKLAPKISIVMGSQSDWSTLKHTSNILKELKIIHEKKIISAHRTPKRLYEFADQAYENEINIIIAGAGGSAHLPGMIAAITHIPVIGVPIESKSLKGLDSLLSIVQMPFGIPVGTVAIGENGAKNAALYAASILSNGDKNLEKRLIKWRLSQTKKVKKTPK